MSIPPAPINAALMSKKCSGLIILVEDDRKLRTLYGDLIRSLGYTVITAKDGEEGLSLLFTNVPRLLIIDIIMPNMDGIELCRRAREILGPRVPIVFMTALDELEIVQICLEAGGDDYIVKSSSLKTIADRVKYWTNVGSSRKAEKRRDNALAAVISEINLGAPAAGLVGGLSSLTDDVVRQISKFLDRACKCAGSNFGNKIEEKLFVLGYATGLLNYWSADNAHIRSRMNEYLKALLLESDMFVAAEIESMFGVLGELVGDDTFTIAVDKGTADALAYKTDDPDFLPSGIAKFSNDIEQKSKLGILCGKVFNVDLIGAV